MMTREEAIKIIEVAKAEVEWEMPLDYQIAFDLAMKALRQPEQQWIPIDKSCPNEGELPDNYSNVFVSTGNDVFMAYRSGYSGYWYISGLDITFSRELRAVDAWMPLPEPYKAG